MDDRIENFCKGTVRGLKEAASFAADAAGIDPKLFWKTVYLTSVCGLMESFDDPEEVREIVVSTAQGVMEKWKSKST